LSGENLTNERKFTEALSDYLTILLAETEQVWALSRGQMKGKIKISFIVCWDTSYIKQHTICVPADLINTRFLRDPGRSNRVAAIAHTRGLFIGKQSRPPPAVTSGNG
jgi:hypothetical protein